MVYYGYSYFSVFFLFFLFFLLILIFLLPNYSKKDVVPPLTTQNYAITLPTNHNNLSATDSTAQFQDLIIQDGESGSGGSALDFGGSGPDEVPVDFDTEYEYKNRRVAGYFVLYLSNENVNNSGANPPSFYFRVVDKNDPDSSNPTLAGYNKGFSSLTTLQAITHTQSLYRVTIPFNVPSQTSGHKLTVQIAPMRNTSTIGNGDIQLNSAYIYYY